MLTFAQAPNMSTPVSMWLSTGPSLVVVVVVVVIVV
jgi:hypothetical protein